MNYLGFFDNLADEFLAALVHDFSDPVVQKQLMREIDGVINNIQNPMIRMLVSQYKGQALDYIANKAAPFFQNVVMSDPPESVDASATVVKEVVSEKVDSLADRIKREISRKKGENN